VKTGPAAPGSPDAAVKNTLTHRRRKPLHIDYSPTGPETAVVKKFF